MASAVILCAGKGTRMGDDSRSKVSFDCVGIPVIKRIVQNMKAGGVKRIVVVVGHLAHTVMDALDGEDGVVYAYQKEQKVLLVCFSPTVYDYVRYICRHAYR